MQVRCTASSGYVHLLLVEPMPWAKIEIHQKYGTVEQERQTKCTDAEVQPKGAIVGTAPAARIQPPASKVFLGGICFFARLVLLKLEHTWGSDRSCSMPFRPTLSRIQ